MKIKQQQPPRSSPSPSTPKSSSATPKSTATPSSASVPEKRKNANPTTPSTGLKVASTPQPQSQSRTPSDPSKKRMRVDPAPDAADDGHHDSNSDHNRAPPHGRTESAGPVSNPVKKVKKVKNPTEDHPPAESADHPVERREEKEDRRSRGEQIEGGEASTAVAAVEETILPGSQRLPNREGFLTAESFDDVEELSEKMRESLRSEGYTRMTEIQAKSIRHLLAGKDLIGQAKTGSGKTLAFLVPSIEVLTRAKFSPRNGTGVIIISPTRELALQIYGVAKSLMQNLTQTLGIVIGGANRRDEADRLQRGVNLLIGTPGRLLDHLQHTKGFHFANLQVLCIDEADRILEIGFEEDLREIIKLLPATNRQTLLFSATQTTKVEDLVRLSVQNKPVCVGITPKGSSHSSSSSSSTGSNNDGSSLNPDGSSSGGDAELAAMASTVSGLEQGYVVIDADLRFLLLFTFLRKNLRGKKCIIFMASCNEVQFFADLLNYVDVPVLDLHGQQKQQKRTNTFFQFCNAREGILLCTDVAARGLDIPDVDWIVQFDPPSDPREYIHRVGRTARAGGKGRALLFLLPQEVGFLKHLKHARIPVNEYDFPQNKLANVQSQLESLVEKNYHLHRAAREAYRSYLFSYMSHPLKDVFDVTKLDLQKVAKSMGFSNPPKVDLRLADFARKASKKRGKFTSDNPYGKSTPSQS